MRLLKFSNRQIGPTQLETHRLLLRRPAMQDFDAWAQLRLASEAFLRPYEPKWSSGELSKSSYRLRMRRQEADINSGRGLPWFLFDRANPEILFGGLTLSNIRHGVAQTATLGYWMGQPYAGHGYMREAVDAIAAHVFEVHNLHRIEAATLVDNMRSQKLLEKCKFQREGIARSYLKINDEWHDHVLFARLASDV